MSVRKREIVSLIILDHSQNVLVVTIATLLQNKIMSYVILAPFEESNLRPDVD